MIFVCNRCGKPRPKGRLTCRECGRTEWLAIVVGFVVSIVIKIGALCGGHWFENGWAQNLSAWGGGILGGFLFFGAGSGLLDALLTSRVARRRGPDRSVGPPVRFELGDTWRGLFAFLMSIGFVILGNTIGFELGIILGILTFGLGFAFLCAIINVVVLSFVKKRLPVRLVAEPAASPVKPVVPEGIFAFDPTYVTMQPSAVEPPTVKTTPPGEVSLHIRCARRRVPIDSPVTIVVDGQLIAVGSFRQGFDMEADTTPGSHQLQIRWEFTTQTFIIDFSCGGSYETELSWSWFWKYVVRRPEE